MTRLALQSTGHMSLVSFCAVHGGECSGVCQGLQTEQLAVRVVGQRDVARRSASPSVIKGPSTQIRRPSGEAQAPQMPTPHLVR